MHGSSRPELFCKKSFFNIVAWGLQLYFKKYSGTGVFFREFCEIKRTPCFHRTLLVAASGYIRHCNVWRHSPECLATFFRMFEDILWNIWKHFPHSVPRFCIPVFIHSQTRVSSTINAQGLTWNNAKCMFQQIYWSIQQC